jgi:hydroxymethylpyrimidine pyrophosphatase-like HAD family hydrolase
VATVRPHETTVLETIQALGLELEIVFNKEAVMVLPTGHNKATGLRRALEELDLDPQAVVGIGDAENDHAFLELCGFSVAVANSVDALKEHADLVTRGERGAGVEELIEALLADDLARLAPSP